MASTLAVGSHSYSIIGEQGDSFKRFVSFYFTNVPELISYFYIWKGFEVCRMLLDVYLANGKVYGFVQFRNVCDMGKVSQYLNYVWFGHYHASS